MESFSGRDIRKSNTRVIIRTKIIGTELIESVGEIDAPDSSEMLRIMLEGKRLRDISDLPLDLAT